MRDIDNFDAQDESNDLGKNLGHDENNEDCSNSNIPIYEVRNNYEKDLSDAGKKSQVNRNANNANTEEHDTSNTHVSNSLIQTTQIPIVNEARIMGSEGDFSSTKVPTVPHGPSGVAGFSNTGGPSQLPSSPKSQQGINPDRLGKGRPKKQHKFFFVGEKAGSNIRRKKLSPIIRNLVSVSLGDTEQDEPRHNSMEEKSLYSLSRKFSGGSILCGGSISDNDIRSGNNKFWALQNNVVSQKVWQEAKNLGVKGNCVNLIEEGEIRDQAAKGRRENTNGVP